MAIAHRRAKLFYIKIFGKRPRAKALSADVNRIRSAADGGVKTLHISRGREQLGQPFLSSHTNLRSVAKFEV
jgi:hypothetical protein